MDQGSEAFQLPAINSGHKGSPFKGFLDISIVHQKLRKNMKSQDGTMDAELLFDFQGRHGHKRGKSKPIVADTKNDMTKVQPKGTRFAGQDK